MVPPHRRDRQGDDRRRCSTRRAAAARRTARRTNRRGSRHGKGSSAPASISPNSGAGSPSPECARRCAEDRLPERADGAGDPPCDDANDRGRARVLRGPDRALAALRDPRDRSLSGIQPRAHPAVSTGSLLPAGCSRAILCSSGPIPRAPRSMLNAVTSRWGVTVEAHRCARRNAWYASTPGKSQSMIGTSPTRCRSMDGAGP